VVNKRLLNCNCNIYKVVNPESCKNVKISNCYIDVGDDCITIKSGAEDDLLQKQYPCENIVITNYNMAHGHGGVVIGSEMSGGVKNVTITNCVFQNTDRGIRVKTRRKRGGSVERVIISNIIMENVLAAITLNEYYCCGADINDEEIFTSKEIKVTKNTPIISEIIISDVICHNTVGAGNYMYGLPEKPIRGITINNIDINVCGCEEGIEAIAALNHLKIVKILRSMGTKLNTN